VVVVDVVVAGVITVDHDHDHGHDFLRLSRDCGGPGGFR
jgi:hypothetical protein